MRYKVLMRKADVSYDVLAYDRNKTCFHTGLPACPPLEGIVEKMTDIRCFPMGLSLSINCDIITVLSIKKADKIKCASA